MRDDFRRVLDARHLITGEQLAPRHAVLDDIFLGERVAEAHGDAALHLALQRARVDRAADVIRGDDFEDAHRAGFQIDLHQRCLRRIRECEVHVPTAAQRLCLRRVVLVAGARLAPFLAHPAHDFAQLDRRPVVAHDPLLEAQLVRRHAEPLGHDRAHGVAHGRRRVARRIAADVGLP